MIVHRIEAGPWKQNCFVVARDGDAAIIDPGGNAKEILEYLDTHELRLRGIVNTHGHFDHIGAVVPVMERTDAPFFISTRESKVMRSANLLRFIFRSTEKVAVPEAYLDLDRISDPQDAPLGLECIATPGHTPGGYSFRFGDHLFTGDTVLPRMSRNTKLPGGDDTALARSLDRLGDLPRTMVMHPGHGRDMPLGQALDAVAAHHDSSVESA